MVALFNLQLKVDMLCHNLDRSLNLSIFGHIQLQDLNLTTPKNIYQQGSQNSTRMATILKENKGRKRIWDLYKRCISHPLNSNFFQCVKIVVVWTIIALHLEESGGFFNYLIIIIKYHQLGLFDIHYTTFNQHLNLHYK